MITLTREEAQQVLDALEQITKQMLEAKDALAERGARPVTNTHHQKIWDKAFAAYTDHALPAAEILRDRLAEPELVKFNAIKACEYARGYRDGKAEQQLSAADKYAHRLALMLECLMLSPSKTWNAASDLLSEYHEAVRKEHEAAGEPYVSGFGKD